MTKSTAAEFATQNFLALFDDFSALVVARSELPGRCRSHMVISQGWDREDGHMRPMISFEIAVKKTEVFSGCWFGSSREEAIETASRAIAKKVLRLAIEEVAVDEDWSAGFGLHELAGDDKEAMDLLATHFSDLKSPAGARWLDSLAREAADELALERNCSKAAA